MDKKRKNETINQKGFTLIELLAVIVILGLLMALAIPAVTRYITQSRRKTIVTSIDGYVRSVSTAVNDNNYGPMSDGKTLYYIPVSNKSEDSCTSMEKGGLDPFGNWLKAYVVVHYNAEEYSYDYYFTFIDDAGYGMALTKSDEISTNGKNVKNPAPVTLDNIDKQNLNGETIRVLSTDSCHVNTSVVTNGSEDNPTIDDTNKIYWALQDNDSNGDNETLVFSSEEVNGVYKGYIEEDATFTSYRSIPWIVGNYSSSSNLSYNVKKIIVEDVISPKAINSWFYGVGYNASTFEADLTKIKTDDVTNMTYTFYNTGYKATSFNLNISNWNTSKVTNMNHMFYGAGYKATTYNMNLSNLNTSNVTNMSYMLSNTGGSTTNWNIGNISNWNVSNVTNMSYMFYYAGTDATFFYLNLSGWNTSKVTNMTNMFGAAGMSSNTFNVDLSGFDTSAVTNMKNMFYNTGCYSKTFIVNLSGFDTSKVTNMTSMFAAAGRNANTFRVTIPKTNKGDPLVNNTTSTFYGKDTSVYCIAKDSTTPSANKPRSFTLASQ